MKNLIAISDSDSINREIYGGKGASLGILYQNGFHVPNGYIISANVYSEFILSKKLDIKISEYISSIDISSVSSLQNISNNIVSLFEDSSIDNQILSVIENQIDHSKKYAIRSSATSEDGEHNAWAGQLQTFLNVSYIDMVKYIKKCWLSVFQPRALYYRKKNNIQEHIYVAVVIQEMINSTYSGVSFSINPVNQSQNIIIESINGIGEAIVSGNVTPNIYTCSKNQRMIIDKKVYKQERAVICSPNDGVKWVQLDADEQIDDSIILDIAEITQKIENIFRKPIDMEWAVKDNVIYILQARPITTVNENLTIYEKILLRNDWEYYVTRNFNWFIENTQIKGSSEELQNRVLGFNVALQNYLILNGNEYFSRSEENIVNSVFKTQFEKDINFFDKFSEIEYRIVDKIKEFINYLKGIEYNFLSNTELQNLMKDFNELYCESFVPTFSRPDSFLEIQLKKELNKMNLSTSEKQEIFSAIATCPNFGKLAYSSEPVDLLKIAIKVLNGQNVEQDLIEHCQEYSWLKSPASFDIEDFSMSDYRERIEYLIHDKESPNVKLSKIMDTREKNDINFKRIIENYNFSTKIIKLANAIRQFIYLRTYTTEFSDKLFYIAKHSIFNEISKRSGLMISDIVMLSADEIIDFIENNYENINQKHKLVKLHKSGYYLVWLDKRIYIGFGEIANKIDTDISSIYKQNPKSDELLYGTSAYCGLVRGTVKILNSYEDIYKVEKGNIIVASMTTPDYISAMEKASGFITDEGGITCHAAIISREFKIPCIVGTKNATSFLHDNDIVEMNAYTGEIRKITN